MALNYYFLVFISSLGLPVGIFLAHAVKEEIVSGKKYFSMVKHIFFFIIFYSFMIYLKLNIFLSLFFSLSSTLIIFFTDKKINVINTGFIYYVLFSLILYETKNSTIPVISIFVFIFGLILSATRIEKFDLKRNILTIIPELLIYLALSFFLLLLFGI